MIHRRFPRFPTWLVLILGAGLLTSASLSWLAHRVAQQPAAGAPARVILFAPNLTETAFALGYGDRIVGIDDFAVWPPALMDLPRVGGMVDPNLERILALAPDLLVVQGRNDRLREFARGNGIRLGSVTMDTDLASVLAGISGLDSLLSGGEARQAPALVAYLRQEFATVSGAAATLAHPRVLLVLGRQPDGVGSLWTAGKGTFLTDLLALAGGESITADRGRDYFELSLEALVAAAPEVVLEMRPGEVGGTQDRDRAQAVWRRAGLTAVRVELCTFDGGQIPGPRMGETARAFFAALHPDAPALPDPPPTSWEQGPAAAGATAGSAAAAARALERP